MMISRARKRRFRDFIYARAFLLAEGILLHAGDAGCGAPLSRGWARKEYDDLRRSH